MQLHDYVNGETNSRLTTEVTIFKVESSRLYPKKPNIPYLREERGVQKERARQDANLRIVYRH